MALYDESHNERPRDVFKTHKEKIFKDALGVQRDRVAAVTSLLDDVAFLDQYPANRVPFKFSKRYDIPLTSARHVLTPAEGGAGVGFESLAPVATLGDELLPVNGNMFVNREGAFYLTATEAYGFVSLSYDSDPGLAGGTFVNTTPVSGLFNNALRDNGGALMMNFFYGHPQYENKPNISFDMRFYDKKRGRFLNTGRLPAQEICKDKDVPLRFDVNTEVEPRLRILECRMGDLLDTDQAFDASQFRGYLYVVFSGYKVLEV